MLLLGDLRTLSVFPNHLTAFLFRPVRLSESFRLTGPFFLCQISDIQVNGQSDDMTAKEKLLLWSQRMVEGNQGLRCDNFTNSWRDGRLFNAIIHKLR